MVKFDDFTIKYLSMFYNKREPIVFPDLKKLRTLVKNSFNKNVKYDTFDYEIPINKIKKLADTKWVDKDMLHNLETLHSNKKICWMYRKIKHTIYIKSTQNKFDNFKDRLSILINCLNFIYDKKPIKEDRPLNMYLILTPLKKVANNIIIGPKNINSGYTDFISKEILIWREEEFEKVIFHEMVHYMDLDVRNMAFSDNELPHDIEGPKSYYEAFTDVWGVTYYLIYISIVTNKSVNSLFEMEYQFMKNQAHYFNDFFGLKNWDTKKEIKQYSPAFTYFIIKFLLFKTIIESNDLSLMERPKEALSKIFNNGFTQEKYENLNSARMTLLQLY
jgi:hypothetical protein